MLTIVKSALVSLAALVIVAAFSIVGDREEYSPCGVPLVVAEAAHQGAIDDLSAAIGNALFAFHYLVTVEGTNDVAAASWTDAKCALSTALGNALFATALVERVEDETANVPNV